MADTVKDLGTWTEYTPDTMPEIPGVVISDLPAGMRFARNADGVDWYVARAGWPADVLCVQVWPVDPKAPEGPGVVQSVTWGAADSAVPFGCRVLQISGHPTDDTTPWKVWQFKTYNPKDGTFTAPSEDVKEVAAVQAEIQLSRMKMPDGKTSVLDALTDKLPSAGVEANLWYRRAQNWRIDDPNVQTLGEALGISPEAMQAAFNDASKIGVA